MRLWTLHPKHLDAVGLVAVWREALLAQAVLLGRTRGYANHPQLTRFRELADPCTGIGAYLLAVHQEATSRGYAFDSSRIVNAAPLPVRVRETRGQLLYEWSHLARKLRSRNPKWYMLHHRGHVPSAHPIFRIVAGGVRAWERTPRERGQGSHV